MQVMPLSESDDSIAVAMVNPLDDYTRDGVRFAASKPVLARVTVPADFDMAFERLYGEGKSEILEIAAASKGRDDAGLTDDIERLKDRASEAPVIRLVNLLVPPTA